jgi:hypothetical protein
MDQIQQLDDAQAVYTLYRSVEPYADPDQINLDDAAQVREIVHAAFANAVGEARADELMAGFASDAQASDLARATLVALRERPELIEGVDSEIDANLAEPPSEEKMDLGISLGLLALAGMAMAFMGTLEVKRETSEGPEGRKASWSVVFSGSDKVPELVSGILSGLGLG